MSTVPLIIIGAGGHGAEVAGYACDQGLPLLGAIDDGKQPGPWQGTLLLGGLADLPAICAAHDHVRYLTAFGSNALRRKIVERVESLGISNLLPATLQHSSAWTGLGVQIGSGTLLAPQSLVTTRATIGKHSIVNVKASVSHDCVIGDWCNLNPGATLCGDVQLGEGCYIGAGATVIEKVKIGAWTVVGAGAVVIKDVPEGVTVVGVPARISRRQGRPESKP
jgi:acetyltransferase EpsM